MTENIEKVLAGLANIEKSIETVQSDMKAEKASRADADKKIAELGEAQLKFARQLLELQQKSQTAAADSAAPRTLGAALVKSDSYRAFQADHRHASIVFANKAEGDPITVAQARLQAYHKPGIVSLPQRELLIESLLPKIGISQNTVEFVKEKTFTNAAAPVAEGAKKAYSTWESELAQTPVQVVAHWTKITRQLADDAAALEAFINARMVYGVDLAAENQILSGNGTAPNLSGLMNAGNYTAQAFTLAQIGGSGATLLDLLRVSFASVNALNYRTSAVILNPLDWALLQGIKTNGGEYLLGSPADSFASMNVWGVPVVASAAMTQGKFLAGDFASAATLYDRMQTVVDIATQNEDDFLKKLYTIRAERRLALAVERPTALIGGNLTVPAS